MKSYSEAAQKCELRETRVTSALTATIIAGVCFLLAGCDIVAPRVRASTVTISSPVDTVLAVYRAAQLHATAWDENGKVLESAPIAWSASPTSVLTVTGDGVVEPIAKGTGEVVARTNGATGTIRFRVVEVAVDSIATIAADPFAAALIGNVSIALQAGAGAAWASCETGVSTGNVMEIARFLTALDSLSAAATNPTDKVLLGNLQLYAQRVRQLSGL